MLIVIAKWIHTNGLLALICTMCIGAGAFGASIAEASPRCMEDMPCWTWSTMGNHKRGIVTVYGTPKVVGPCAYRTIYFRTPRSMRYLLGPKLRGDATARLIGCIGNVQNY